MIEDHLQAIEREIAAIREELNPPDPNTGIVRVSNQADLQKAIDGLENKTILVKPGIYDEIILRNGKKNLIINTDTKLPVGRVDKEWSDALVHIKSFKAEPKAEGYVLQGMKFLPGVPDRAIITLGNDREVDPFNVPNDITFDQCIVNANPDTGGKRGLAWNCRSVSFLNSIAEGFWWKTPDSQAIGVWNGPGPFTVYNCSLSGSAECFMSGGADCMSEAMQPSALYFSNNHVWKPLEWFNDPTIVVKNLFELKDMKFAVIQNNLFENNWKDDQVGFAIVFTPRNQYNHQPYAIVSNVDFSWNVVRNVGAGVNILGDDNLAPSLRTTNINICNNLLYDIDPVKFPGSAGRIFQILRGPLAVTIKNNTCLGIPKINSFIDIEQKPEKLLINENIFTEGSYGLKVSPAGLGYDAFMAQCIESEFLRNYIIPSNVRTIKYGLTNVKSSECIDSNMKSLVPAGVDIDLLRTKVLF